jgi:hypothetical protein
MPAPGARRPAGLTALAIFFALGTIPAAATALALAWPGAWSETMWRLKPEAPADLARLGPFAIPLMTLVAAACAGTAVGLWIGARWGHRLAAGLLGVNLLGDTLNAVLRGDWRTLIGIPIGGAMLAYLLSRRARTWFEAQELTDRPAGGE